MNRTSLKELAEIRIDDATVLYRSARFSAAYYLVGYAVECALKACIANQFKEHQFPDKRLVQDSYTHDLSKLIKLAGLEIAFNNRISSDPDFEISWSVVKDWTEGRAMNIILMKIKWPIC